MIVLKAMKIIMSTKFLINSYRSNTTTNRKSTKLNATITNVLLLLTIT